MMQKKLLQLLNGNSDHAAVGNRIPPIWMMRQAGRYLPEYRAIRAKHKDFLSFCFHQQDVLEVTLQPLHRFGFDAAIIFSDILVIPYAMGIPVEFIGGKGPVLARLSKEDVANFKEQYSIDSHTSIGSQTSLDLPSKAKVRQARAALIQQQLDDKLSNSYKAISNVSKILAEKFPSTSLIGFAGCPFTLSCYMIDGGSSKDFALTKKFIYQNYDIYQNLIDILTELVIEHLTKQILAGAEIVKIFDSWSGLLNESEFHQFCILPAKKIAHHLAQIFPDVPVIAFPKAAGAKYLDYVKQVRPAAIAVDFNCPLSLMENLKEYAVVQGNIDPNIICYGTKSLIKKELERLKSVFDHKYIFNLGHGVIKETPIENIEYMLEIIRQ